VLERHANDLAAISRIDVVPTILEVVCRVTGLRFSAVARVTEDRWTACAVRDEIAFGLRQGDELRVETTLCDEIRRLGETIVIDNVAEDPAYCGHDTPRRYGFQSYISVPIRRPDGAFFGTLCALDPRPARLNKPETVGLFELSAQLIGFHLDVQDRLEASEAALEEARRTAELREQFIAVLGHDLRSPLGAVDAGVKLLQRRRLDAGSAEIVELMRQSVGRIGGLIDDVLDFARGWLGNGIPLDAVPDPGLADALAQVTAEQRSIWPDRTLETDFRLDRPVTCDSARIAQLFSNLLANALTHGDPATPVTARARAEQGAFTLCVANGGAPIPAEVARELFLPFSQPAARKGLGLGLYIASEIARAHGGTLELAPDESGTRVTFRMPLDGTASKPPARPGAPSP
jgi:signal transduction histidine kinase